MRFCSLLLYPGVTCLLLTTGIVRADHPGVGIEGSSASAIRTISGATLSRGETMFNLDVNYTNLDEISDADLEALGAADEHVHSIRDVNIATLSFAYGVTDDLTLGVSQPYIARNDIRVAHHHAGMGEVEFAGDSAGHGDTTVFGQYRFFQDQVTDLAVIAGVKIPTGVSDERENPGELFDTEHQPGSGSWDPFAGFAVARSFGRAGLSAHLLYLFTGDADQQTNLGDYFTYNLAFSYRLVGAGADHDHHEHSHEPPGLISAIDLVLEMNGEFAGANEIADREDEHSGGHTLYFSPGVRLGLGRNWSAYASVGVPVMNDLNGRQSEPDYRVIGGLGFSF